MIKLPEIDELESRPIAVIGMGTMGRRLAARFATRGGEVRAYDSNQRVADEGAAYARETVADACKTIPGATPGRIVTAPDLASAVRDAWLVVEAVAEKPDLKTALFGEFDRLAPPGAILATNSSSYKSSEVIGKVTRPERVLNMHFYLPKLRSVELMTCGKTDEAYIHFLKETLPRWGFAPYVAMKESTGLIFNRVWAAIKREAIQVIAEGIATPEDVDALFREVLATEASPFRLMDQVGLDVVLDIEDHYAAERPGLPVEARELLRRYVAQGKLGVKTGSGFYDYPKP
ncbi:3-hydroxybutyryl-CoA dehydrogenase [Roseiarcus fermentans]|uniref:3-hydroxybutyryl-CoA dehydrogenase n=1 Tax=Roseiarcus fermentans TaxID=1473586 RepID=A0A366FU63_9HYPH|nr:3-hydroxyacyl-CoA dehydrogenase family protein [Roseiarcus fermentans]RBP17275.1 3-hydroxybutyryl-CoA dehydrogenase [Roseiarcus fermentans]